MTIGADDEKLNPGGAPVVLAIEVYDLDRKVCRLPLLLFWQPEPCGPNTLVADDHIQEAVVVDVADAGPLEVMEAVAGDDERVVFGIWSLTARMSVIFTAGPPLAERVLGTL